MAGQLLEALARDPGPRALRSGQRASRELLDPAERLEIDQRDRLGRGLGLARADPPVDAKLLGVGVGRMPQAEARERFVEAGQTLPVAYGVQARGCADQPRSVLVPILRSVALPRQCAVARPLRGWVAD